MIVDNLKSDIANSGHGPAIARRRILYLQMRRTVELYVGVPVLVVVAALMRIFDLRQKSLTLKAAVKALAAGQIAIVGPTIAIEIEGGGSLPKGLITEADVVHRAGLEADVATIDAEYARAFGPFRDTGILLRAAWIRLITSPETPDQPTRKHFKLLGIIINNSTIPLILESILEIIKTHPNYQLRRRQVAAATSEADEEWGRPAHVCFVNANNFNVHMQHLEYRIVLREAELILPDGIGVGIALQMAGGQLHRNLNGTDLFPPLAELLTEQQIPVFVLGADNEVSARAVQNIEADFPRLQIAGSHSGFFSEDNEPALCERINTSGALVVVVGMGTPRQELWFRRNAARLNVAVVFSMGGLLDFLGERNKRAPRWMRQAGLEWVYRLLQEPGRLWHRYIIGNPLFLLRAWRWTRGRNGQK